MKFHKKTLGRLVVLALLATLGYTIWWTVVRPRIIFRSFHLESDKIDFGTGIPGERLSDKVVITNNGSRPATISKIDVSCGCTSATVSSWSLSPGRRIDFSLSIVLPMDPGPFESSANVIWTVEGSDARFSKVVRVVANVEPVLDPISVINQIDLSESENPSAERKNLVFRKLRSSKYWTDFRLIAEVPLKAQVASESETELVVALSVGRSTGFSGIIRRRLVVAASNPETNKDSAIPQGRMASVRSRIQAGRMGKKGKTVLRISPSSGEPL